jgi:hypothetical protein
MHPDLLKGERWLDDLLRGHPDRMHRVTRLSIPQFLKLQEWLGTHTSLRGTESISIGQKLLIFLNFCGPGTTFRQLAEHTAHSLATISRIFEEVLLAMTYLHKEFVTLPSAHSVPYGIMGKPKLAPYFSDCYGAVDGSLIPAWIKGQDQSPWRCRKNFLAQNVMAAMNFEEYFVFVLPGWEGSAHDSRVISDAIAKGFRAESSTLPGREQRYYLADAGYTPFGGLLLPPYRGVRYHLKEWSKQIQQNRTDGEGNKPQNKEELFNLRHAMARNVVERGFGQWKSQWSVLDSKKRNMSIRSQVLIVYATTALHNWLKWYKSVFGADDDDDENVEGVSDSNEVALQDGGEDVDNGQFVRSSEADKVMLGRRDAIAEKMWQNYCAYIRSESYSI